MTLKEGTVTSVNDEDGVILLGVQLNDGGHRSNVAFGKLSSDFIVAPQEGDIVAVQDTDGGRQVATSVISKSDYDSPEVGGGELAFQLDEDNLIRVKDGDDGFKFIMELTDDITIETEGDVDIDSVGNVTIKSEEDVEVNAGGDIILGEDGEPVARQNHTHDFDYSWSDDAGSDSGTTSEPNEEGSELKLP